MINTVSKTPDWIVLLPSGITRWLLSVMDTQHFGLFRDCVDSQVPHAFPASALGLTQLKAIQSFNLDQIPGYSPQKLEETVRYVQNCQQPDTGLFIDPYLDDRFINKDDAHGHFLLRKNVTKYTIDVLLPALEAKPLYPYSVTGEQGEPDPQAYLDFIKAGDWDKSWGIGSHAAGQTRELFYLIEQGQEKYIPFVCQGLEFILSHQNPKTGMWGKSSTPLFQQISGALKIIRRFMFYMDMDLPYMEQLADSCIEHHASGGFYASDVTSICFPRNVAEMCAACLDHCDYRRDELLETLASIAEYLRQYLMPDSAFSVDTIGKLSICQNESFVCAPSSTPRGNMNSTQAGIWALGLIGTYLGWDDMPFPDPNAGWRERVGKLRYKIVLSSGGKVEIVRK